MRSPLQHLNMIFELLQKYYWHSVQDEKRKLRIKRKQPNLVETPLYLDFCQDKKDKKGEQGMRSLEYTIRIMARGNTVYKVHWWNGLGREQCNALTLTIGENEREYSYLRFKCNIDDIGLGLVWYV